MSKPLGGFVSAHNKVHGDEPMFSSLKAPEDLSLKPAGAEYWHLRTVVIPRLSIAGGFVSGRVWRRHDGRRWQYRAITNTKRMGLDRRSAARISTDRSALLFFKGQRGARGCYIVDISHRGVKLRTHHLPALPIIFELTFDNFATIRECKIWRNRI